MKKKLFIITVIIAGFASLSLIFRANQKFIKAGLESTDKKFHFAILPHFMINQSAVHDFYQFLSKDFITEDIQNVIIISPNHFNLWDKRWINSFNQKQEQQICFHSNCISSINPFNSSLILTGKSPLTQEDFFDLTQKEWGQNITKEHGIGEHFYYIKQYFPSAKVIPLVISRTDFSQIDDLSDYLTQFHFQWNTLILASVDFSHYVDELFAYVHDLTSRYTIKNSKQIQDFQKLEVDCPPCLYLISSLADQQNQQAHMYFRDSSQSLYNTRDNTSRLFVFYDKTWIQHQNYISWFTDNGVTLSFFWDLIYDRGVSSVISTGVKQNGEIPLSKHFDIFLPKDQIIRHQTLRWIDLNIANLETPLLSDCNLCDTWAFGHPNKIRFCSNPTILQTMEAININAFTFANNHTYDCGDIWIQETQKNLEENEFLYRGFEDLNWNLSSKKISIRGQDLEFFAFDFTISQNLSNESCKKIQASSSQWNIPIISVHRWIELENEANQFQIDRAHQLIDCGAQAIIGHHPHVRQGTDFYKWYPIVYSLWNFLFDQNISPETKSWHHLLLNIPNTGSIQIWTGSFDAYISVE